MQYLEYLDWIAFATGIVGTALWAHKGTWAKWASVWWLASSMLWLVFAWQHDLLALALEMVLTAGLVGYGVWNWVFRGKSVEAQLPLPESTRSTAAAATASVPDKPKPVPRGDEGRAREHGASIVSS